MRPLEESEIQQVFEKLFKFVGKNLKNIVDRADQPHCFRLHKKVRRRASDPLDPLETRVSREASERGGVEENPHPKSLNRKLGSERFSFLSALRQTRELTRTERTRALKLSRVLRKAGRIGKLRKLNGMRGSQSDWSHSD